LKVALLLGVEVHPEVSFEGFVEPCLKETLDGKRCHHFDLLILLLIMEKNHC